MTKDDTELTNQEFANLAMLGGFTGTLPEPANKKDNLYSGKQLFSLFLPTDFNYIWTSKWSKGTGGKQKDIVIKIDIEGLEKKLVESINFEKYENVSQLLIESLYCSRLIKKRHSRSVNNGYIENIRFDTEY